MLKNFGIRPSVDSRERPRRSRHHPSSAKSRSTSWDGPGTYYWQVKTADNPIEANNGTWWSFTVGAPVITFGKLTPGAGGIVIANVANFTWQAAPGAQFYEFCVDAVNNNQCDTMWFPSTATSRLHGALTDGTYYWQVRVTTANGTASANDGAWWTIHVDAPDPIREYIYLGGTLLAALTFTTGDPVLTYYHTDMLGSVRAVTSATGAVLLRHDFGPFGEGGSLLGDPRQFTGQERDSETALDYLKARYLRPVWGRFTTPDASAFMDPFVPQSLNPYAYVVNNPLRWTDPSGHQAQDPQSPTANPDFRVEVWGGLEEFCLGRCPVDPVAFGWEGSSGFFSRSMNSGALRNIVSIGVGFIPGVGSAQSVVELISGRDYITGEQTSRSLAGMGIVAGLFPGGKGLLKGGTAAARALGRAGETAVRAAHDIGSSRAIAIAGRTRIPDGINLAAGTLSEVKNVRALSYTGQLRDYTAFARQEGLTFELYVREGARLSGPLQEAIASGAINLKVIPR